MILWFGDISLAIGFNKRSNWAARGISTIGPDESDSVRFEVKERA